MPRFEFKPGAGGGSNASHVIHGADANYARPAVAGPVFWYGEVDPVNADDAQDLMFYAGGGSSGGYVSLAGTTVGSPVVIKPNTDTRAGVWEYVHNAPSGYILHLMTGLNAGNGAALIGMGVDNDGVGLFVNNKKAGTGIKIDQNSTITSSEAYGLEVNHYSTVAPAVSIQQAPNTIQALRWFAQSTTSDTQDFLTFVAAASVVGQIKSKTGKIHWKADIQTHDGGSVRATGNETQADDNQTKLRADSVEMSTWTGSAGLYWHKRIHHAGQSMLVQTANTQSGGVDGAPTWQTALEFKNNGGTNQIGFFGATPVSRPARPTDLAGVISALAALGLTA